MEMSFLNYIAKLPLPPLHINFTTRYKLQFYEPVKWKETLADR